MTTEQQDFGTVANQEESEIIGFRPVIVLHGTKRYGDFKPLIENMKKLPEINGHYIGQQNGKKGNFFAVFHFNFPFSMIKPKWRDIDYSKSLQKDRAEHLVKDWIKETDINLTYYVKRELSETFGLMGWDAEAKDFRFIKSYNDVGFSVDGKTVLYQAGEGDLFPKDTTIYHMRGGLQFWIEGAHKHHERRKQYENSVNP